MPSLADYKEKTLVKALYIGDPGAGKTGSLVSLVKAGYDLRIFDLDNLLGSLIEQVLAQCPEKLEAVKAQTFTDKMKGIEIPVVMNGNSVKVLPFTDGTPTAFRDLLKQLNHWKTPEEDLGVPATWGENTIVVLDTLTSMSEAAFRYAQALNPQAKEPQTYYFTAQQLITNVLDLLASKSFATHVIVTAHITYDRDKEGAVTKGFPRSIGSALNDKIGGHFNSILRARDVGNGRRQIELNSDGLISLKNPVSHKLSTRTLPLETGLADFFAAVRK